MTRAIDSEEIYLSCIRLLFLLVLITAAGLALEPQLPGALVGGWIAFILAADGCLLAQRCGLNLGHVFYRDFLLVIPSSLRKIVTKTILFIHWLDTTCFRPVRLWIRAVIHWLIASLFWKRAARIKGPGYESIGCASFFIINPHSLPLRSPPVLVLPR